MVALAQKSLRSIVRMFKQAGARCRKHGEEYVCSLGYVKAYIDPAGIKLVVEGEFRGEYGNYKPYESFTERDFITALESATGARDVYISIPGQEARLCLEYHIGDADKAVETFKKLANNEFTIAVTNLEGEVVLYINDNPVPLNELLTLLETKQP